MTNRSYLLALLLATTFSPAAPRCDGDLARLDNEAQSLLWKAQYAEALVGFRQLAACGSARAMKEIGLLYQQGKGVPRDFVQAKSWYEKAIAAGYTDPGWNAYFLIGGLYEEGGPGLARDFVAAQRWYEKTIAIGDPDAYFYIARLYENGGPGIAVNYATAKQWFEKAIANGQRGRGYERYIGDLYRAGGHGVERNWARARDWYEKSVAAGDHSAEPLLGQLYEEGGPGLPRDWERACFYYRMAGVRQAAAADRVCSD